MIQYLKKQSWPAAVVGSSIGILSIIIIYTMGKKLGASSTFEHIAWFIKLHGNTAKPLIRWQGASLIGVFIGAYISVRLSALKVPQLQSIWVNRFGNDTILRYVTAFIGGFILILGARIARGCTLGHAISGGLQLTVAGFLFMMSLFATGIITAFFIYGKRRSL